MSHEILTDADHELDVTSPGGNTAYLLGTGLRLVMGEMRWPIMLARRAGYPELADGLERAREMWRRAVAKWEAEE